MIALPNLIHQCVPTVAQASIQAIVQIESKGNPWAIGMEDGSKLPYKPHSKIEAEKLITRLEKIHANFDIGLAQININNAHKYGYSATELLDPCTNLKLTSKIFLKNYSNALHVSKSSHEAILKAISAYNTGNFHSGFHNGYVHKVYIATHKELLAFNDSVDIPPIVSDNSTNNNVRSNLPRDNKTKDTTNTPDTSPYRSRSLLYIQQRKPTPNELTTIQDS